MVQNITLSNNTSTISTSLPIHTRKPTYTKFVSDQLQIQNKLNKEYQFADAQKNLPKRLWLQYPLFNEAQEKPLSVHSETVQVGPYTAHIASAQGRRESMEDTHVAQLLTVSNKQIPLFGVFDGHGGTQASAFLQNNLPAYLEHYLDKFNPSGKFSDVGIWNALKHAFLELDADFKDIAGSTANIALIINDHVWIANIGDARAILSLPDSYKQLSEDAKPDDRRYKRSIEKRGGKVTYTDAYRINGIHAVGRAFGDHSNRGRTNKCSVPHAPKITKTSIKDLPANSSLLIGCDGVWDVATTPQVSAYIQQNLADASTAANIITKAYNGGSGDNLSALHVRLA